jgi:lysine-ketoglutarate reductase/saccharopine dehydrogenase-like protein (TIGR00300 family)
MSFELPEYHEPDFAALGLANAPDARIGIVGQDGIAPEGFHSTSMYPEYVKVGGRWELAARSRMDATIVVRPDGSLDVVELRHLKRGDRVVMGRFEDGTEGVYVHTEGFVNPSRDDLEDHFYFRQGRSRETSFSRDYDRLYDLLRYERDHGFVLWVIGPALAFGYDSRLSMQALIEHGFVDGLMSGNALATHDLEAATLHTALGQDVYTQRSQPSGHYNHLDVINRVRRAGSISSFIEEAGISEGIMYGLERNGIPYVLAGSIRDDGPLPSVISDAYAAQEAMRELVQKATTVICVATMLHTIATGNMTPSFCLTEEGVVRPIYFYAIDTSDFVLNKLRDRGSLSAKTIVTNAQDFVNLVARGVGAIG